MDGNWIGVVLGCVACWGWFVDCRAEGLPPAVERAAAAVVQIDNRGYGGGSGAYLGDGLVLSCDHLFRAERGGLEVGRIVVSFPSGFASTAQVVGQDPVWDIALLALERPPANVPVIAWAESAPQPGEVVVSLGYGRSGDLRASLGRVTGYGRDKQRATQLSDTLLATGGARHGDSGGPILSDQGQLVGVLWGSDGRTVVGTQLGMCRRIVERWMAARGQAESAPHHDTQWVSAACPPSGSTPGPGGPSTTTRPHEVAKPVVEDPRLRQLEAELGALRDHLEQLARQPGPAGPPGPVGPRGPAGDAANVDTAQLADEVRRQIAGSIRVKVEPVR